MNLEGFLLKQFRKTRLYRMLTVYQYVALNLPKVITLVGAGLLLGLAGVHIYILVSESALPTWAFAATVAFIVICFVAAVMLTLRPVVWAGWALGVIASIAFVVFYVVSRLAGLPGMPEARTWWDYSPGSLAGACALMYLGLSASIPLGIVIAYPQKRAWHD
ncbi:oxidoreductase [Skermania sp. ID1734]|uniref:oxidoreductase n=1 Tax=Skermania sp. ID1734 TaxID=2597516 RepID=UPI001180519A|nr:oxidoreductase [Skermania sp. ID1734]TSE00964.1 oxidoreductase [Skermania sp. ID1734]